MLFDHGVPAPLRWSLGDHSVDLAKDYGWDTYQNGELLDAVEAECYEVFITTDKSLRHQQNLAVRKLAFIIVTPQTGVSSKSRLMQSGLLLMFLNPGIT